MPLIRQEGATANVKKLLVSALGAAGAIAILTIFSRAAGFIRAWCQNGALGDTASGEAYATANTVPNVLFEIAAGGALAAAVIPLISGFLAQKNQRDAERTASALLTWVVAVGVPVALIVTCGAKPLMSVLLGTDVSEEELLFGATLLRIFAWQIPLYGLSVVCTGLLQAHKKFILPALAPLLSSLCVIATFLLFTRYAGGHQDAPGQISTSAVYLLAWGTTAGVAIFSLPQLVPVCRLITIRPRFTFPKDVGKRTVKMMSAGLLSLCAQQIQIIAVMLFANARGDTGTYPVYTFANQVYMVPYAVLAVPIATAMFPRLSEVAAEKGRPNLARLTARSSRLVFDIGIMCVALLIAVAVPAQAVFNVMRPAAHMDTAMIAMAPGLLGYAFIYHGSRVLYAVESTKAVIGVNCVAWLSSVLAMLILAPLASDSRAGILTILGCALSIGMSLGAVAQLCAIRQVVGVGSLQGLVKSAVIIAPLSVIACVAGYFAGTSILHMWGTGLLVSFVASCVAGVLTLGIAGAAIVVVERKTLKKTRARGAGEASQKNSDTHRDDTLQKTSLTTKNSEDIR